MNNYAYMLQTGGCVPINYSEAIKCLKMAIDKRVNASMFHYAEVLEHDEGVPVNYSEAIKYYKMAVDLREPRSMNNYAKMLEEGKGAAVNKASDAGMLELGDWIEKNKEEAEKYYKMAEGKVKTKY